MMYENNLAGIPMEENEDETNTVIHITRKLHSELTNRKVTRFETFEEVIWRLISLEKTTESKGLTVKDNTSMVLSINERLKQDLGEGFVAPPPFTSAFDDEPGKLCKDCKYKEGILCMFDGRRYDVDDTSSCSHFEKKEK